MDLPEVNMTHVGGAGVGLLAVFAGFRRFFRAEKVSDSAANTTISINASVKELIDQLRNQTQTLTARVEELQKHVLRLDTDLTIARHAHQDCERRHDQATKDIQDLRVKLHVFMEQGIP